MQVVTRESVSTDICVHCIAKLRVSYEFNDMCKKSSKKLQGYLRALISKGNEKVDSATFVNTELSVVVTPLRGYENYDQPNIESYSFNTESHVHREKRKRITKEQRCSLLKRLLTNTESHSKERDKHSYDYYHKSHQPNDYCDFKGGLRGIINFTKNYEFGVKLDKNYNYDGTPLDKLKKFSNDFFRKDFSAFRNTILYIIENKDNFYDSGDSEDEFFNTPPDESDSEENLVKFEEVIIEPDVRIKTEMDYEEEDEATSFSYHGDYEDNIETRNQVKKEAFDNYLSEKSSTSFPSHSVCEDLGMSSSSMQILKNFVGSYSHKRTFSPHNARCRTRDNPYINPLLKEQFLYRSFKCHKCSRYFKSPGYLKAHNSKVH